MPGDSKEITDLFQTEKFIETKNDNYEKIEKVSKGIRDYKVVGVVTCLQKQ